MGPIIKRVIFVVLVCCALGVWNQRTDHDVAVAQQRAGIAVTRVFTSHDGQTHAEEINVKLTRDDASTEPSSNRHQARGAYLSAGERSNIGRHPTPLQHAFYES